MESSIVISIKKLLGIDEELSNFDPDIIMNINMALLPISQLGIGPKTGFFVKGIEDKWVDLFGDREDLEAVKMYIYIKVRLLFDPPSSAFVLDAFERQSKELEWRLNVQAETPTQ